MTRNPELLIQIESWYTQWQIVERLYAEYAARYGITSTTVSVLLNLLDNPKGCTQRSICEALTLPKQTVSSLLTSLEGAQLVSKARSPEDKRNYMVQLTEKGSAFALDIRDGMHRAEYAAFLTLPPKDRAHYTRINEALTQALARKLRAGGHDKEAT